MIFLHRCKCSNRWESEKQFEDCDSCGVLNLGSLVDDEPDEVYEDYDREDYRH